MHLPNFLVIDSIHGSFIVNRHCAYHAESLIKTGATHIESELNKILTVIKQLPNNCIVMDIGANIGFIALPVANLLKTKKGTIFAYEPQRMLYNALCGTVALNDLNNLIVKNCAIGKQNGTIKVPVQDYGKPKDFGMVSLVNHVDSLTNEEVDLICIDEIKLSRLDFIKIDVEGMELDVLQGGEKTIQKYRPWCWIEYWMVDQNSLKHFFDNINYSIFVMDKLNVLCAPKEKLEQLKLIIKAPLL